MKKIILLVFLFCALFAQAQLTTLPNGGFENWTTINFSNPTNYPVTANNDALEKGGAFPITKVQGYHGNYGVQVKSTAEVGVGFFINTNPTSQDPTTWHGGIPYAQKPTRIRGYYKYNVSSGDTGGMFVIFSKNGSSIGSYMIPLNGLHNDYTLFDVTFTPALTQTPDSVIIGIASSWPSPVAGSTLVIDSLTFKGVTSQPALMNGDFEQWTDISVEKINDWYQNNNGNTNALKKIIDAYQGQYAIQLTTFTGEEDGQIRPFPAQIMNGKYPDNCGGNCTPFGGYPYTNQSDVLELYYKYAPQGNDVGTVNLFFKQINGPSGWFGYTELTPTSQYTLKEIPFSLPFKPDSVIIQIQSSKWDQNFTMANVGSVLKVDEVIFRSQKTGINTVKNNEIRISPNPVKEGFAIDANLLVESVIINDLRGATVYNELNTNNYVDVKYLQEGVYLVKLTGKNGTYKGKLIKQK